MASAIVVIIPIFLACIDLYFVIMGYWWTTATCRMAARAAAQGPPSIVLRESPQKRANNFLESNANIDKKIIHVITCTATDTVKTLPDPEFGGAVTGTVSVHLVVDVTPPFLLRFTVPSQKFTVDSTQTCPYTWVMNGKPYKPVN
jgi:hypothetical protein